MCIRDRATIYIATAPKSNAGYKAFGAAMKRAKETGSLAPPKIILNAPTKMMKEQEYGAGYRLSLIHISEPTRLLSNSYAVFRLKKKKESQNRTYADVKLRTHITLILTDTPDINT